MERKSKTIVVIPAYEPPKEFVDYAAEVSDFADCLLVVNDGSSERYDEIFNKIAEHSNVTYISYKENQGKGYALKQAFSYCVENFDSADIIVTADCDGQHKAEDIKRVAQCAKEHFGALVLGSRNFDRENVPARSRFGNKMTAKLFKFFYGVNVYDTQTGLRGFSVETSKSFVKLRGNRFEYEMQMLIDSGKDRIEILELPIETVYEQEKEGHASHFKTFRDSTRVMLTVFSNLNFYYLSSMLSALLDISIFYILSELVFADISALNTFVSTVAARVCSSLLNYTLNRNYVFRGKKKRSVIRYYILCVCQMCASYGIVFLFGNIAGGALTAVKIVGDITLGIISYQIQRCWVFK